MWTYQPRLVPLWFGNPWNVQSMSPIFFFHFLDFHYIFVSMLCSLHSHIVFPFPMLKKNKTELLIDLPNSMIIISLSYFGFCSSLSLSYK